MLRHRYVVESEPSRTLFEFNRDPRSASASERLRAKHLGIDHYTSRPTDAEVQSYFEGYRLPKLSPVLLLPNPSSAFRATSWEEAYGLTPVRRTSKSYPIVSSSNEVVGHIANFLNHQVLFPRTFLRYFDHLGDVVAAGLPVFVRKRNPNSDVWSEGSAQTNYLLSTTVDGTVIAVIGTKDTDGIESASTLEFIFDVVMIVDGARLVRSIAPAAGRSLGSAIDRRLAAWVQKRAVAAAERERLEAAGKWAAQGKDASPDAFAKTGNPSAHARTQDPGAYARTAHPDEVADTLNPAGNTRDGQSGAGQSGAGQSGARSAEDAALDRRILDMHRETWEEIERARATRTEAEILSGDDWMREVSEIMIRVQKRWFPQGLDLG